jgi:histidinol-phosphatase
MVLGPNGSPVTDADRAIEAAVVEQLRQSRPGIPIFGEEHGPLYDGEPTYWAIDPIDGTAAFIAGDTWWGFTICLVEDRQPVAGVASSIGLRRRRRDRA